MSTIISPELPELAILLDQLASAISGLGHGIRRSDGTIDTWSDGGSTYMDAKLPGLEGERLDICLHDGRIFVVRERS